MQTRGGLFRKYAAYFALLVSFGVLASGLTSLAFSYRDTRVLLDALHREKAASAAASIDQFLRSVESHLRAALSALPASASDMARDDQHEELIRLLRVNLSVTEAAWIDAAGIERLRLSRIAPDVVRGLRNRSSDPVVVAAKARKTAFGTVYFRQQTEPYLSMAVAADDPVAGIVVAEINLKFVWDVVRAIRVGESGYAYVVDGQGRLISHPDISLVLRQTDLSQLAQVRAAAFAQASDSSPTMIADTAASGEARASLVAAAPITEPGWFMVIEQPAAEALAPLYATLTRTAAVLLLSLALCLAVSLALARRLTAPIRALQAGAARIGEGQLDQRVALASGDEFEALAHEFNTMADRLHESRSGMEQKIEARTRELAQANRAKSRFLAVASHDLRQPVHALGLYVAQAKEARGEALRESLIDKIELSWQSVSSLLDALLDISRLDSSSLRARQVAFSAQSVLDRIERSCAPAAHVKGLRLRIRPCSTLLMGDPLLLERMLLNLVSNAVRYTRDGGVLVGVRQRGSRARIDVSDTGPGIPADESAHIFDEFYRGQAAAAADTQTDAGEAGLGLGLAIVQRLARLMNLGLTLRSTPGAGSRFSIEVPLAPAGSVVDEAPAHRNIDSGSRGLALVVDDDAAARDAVAGLLAQWGWHVVSADSSATACAALAGDARRLDVIVSDYHLMHENGVDTIACIRGELCRDVAAVLVSGDMTEALRSHAAAQSLHLLHKPVQPAKLRAMLHHLQGSGEVR